MLFQDTPKEKRHAETGPGDAARAHKRGVPRRLSDLGASAAGYIASPELIAAVNVALHVGAPLLLTGEPGCGKSQLAHHLVWYFGARSLAYGLDGDDEDFSSAVNKAQLAGSSATKALVVPQPFVFHTKSTSTAGDLLYHFDTVRYFHDGQDPQHEGEALDRRRYVRRGPLWYAFDAVKLGTPAVLLIDEIDKAPRDFPNDLLHELAQFEFEVREIPDRIGRGDHDPPIVIVTSNDERRLPDAFLRRCIYHRITLTEKLMRDAARVHLQAQAERDSALRPLVEAYATNGAKRVWALRERSLRKKPSTSELLTWLTAVIRQGIPPEQLTEGNPLMCAGALLKDHDDLAAASTL